jgi:hypothetical protein
MGEFPPTWPHLVGVAHINTNKSFVEAICHLAYSLGLQQLPCKSETI